MKKIIFLFVLIGLPASCFAEELKSRVLIPAGTAIVGTDLIELKKQLLDNRAKVEWYSNEVPKREINVNSFEIDTTEVTNKRYKRVKTDHMFPQNLENHPVVNVTWQEASEFCRKEKGRLPSEAEWERAARGDEGLVYPWGNQLVPENVIFLDTGGEGSKLKVGSFALEESGETLLGGTKPVGSIKNGKSPFGIYDMAGNVWEWLDGWYDDKKKMRLLKGGSWLSPASSVRAAVRLGDLGDGQFNDYGFRCVYDLD